MSDGKDKVKKSEQVTDPNILAQLNGGAPTPSGKSEAVTDPNLIAMLEGKVQATETPKKKDQTVLPSPSQSGSDGGTSPSVDGTSGQSSGTYKWDPSAGLDNTSAIEVPGAVMTGTSGTSMPTKSSTQAKPKRAGDDIEPLKTSTKKAFMNNAMYDNPRNREIFYNSLMKDYPMDKYIELKKDAENFYANKYQLRKFQNQVMEDPSDLNAAYNLAKTQSDVGDYLNSTSNYFNILNKDPENLKAYYGLAYNASVQGDDATAISFYDDALKIRPDDPNSYNNRAILQWRTGNMDAAIQDFAQAIQLSPNSHQAHMNMAKALQANGDRDRAEKFAEVAAKLAVENEIQYLMSRGQDIVTSEDDPEPHPKDYIPFIYGDKGKTIYLSPEEYKQQQYIKLQAQFIDALSKGEGPLAFFNPIGAIANNSTQMVKKGVENLGKGLTALDGHLDGGSRYELNKGQEGYLSLGEATTKTVLGGSQVVLGGAMAASPGGLIETGAVGALEMVPQTKWLADLANAPVSTFYEAFGGEVPTKGAAADLFEMADIVGEYIIMKGVESGFGAQPSMRDHRLTDIGTKIKDGIDITESDAQYLKERIGSVDADIKKIAEKLSDEAVVNKQEVNTPDQESTGDSVVEDVKPEEPTTNKETEVDPGDKPEDAPSEVSEPVDVTPDIAMSSLVEIIKKRIPIEPTIDASKKADKVDDVTPDKEDITPEDRKLLSETEVEDYEVAKALGDTETIKSIVGAVKDRSSAAISTNEVTDATTAKPLPSESVDNAKPKVTAVAEPIESSQVVDVDDNSTADDITESSTAAEVESESSTDDAGTIKKIDNDIEILKALPKESKLKKAQAILKRLDQQKLDGLITEETRDSYNSALGDITKGLGSLKLSEADAISAREAEIRETGEAAKKALKSAAGKLKKALEGPDHMKGVKKQSIVNHEKLIDATVSVISKFIDAGTEVTVATNKAIAAIKRSPVYKKLIEDNVINEVEFEKSIRGAIEPKKDSNIEDSQKNTPDSGADSDTANSKPKKSKSSEKASEPIKEKKSVMNRVYNKSNASDPVKKLIKEKGLEYDRFTNEESRAIAKDVVDQTGVEDAVRMADDKSSDIRGAVRTMIYAEAIDHFVKAERDAKLDHEKEYFAERQAELIDKLDMFVRDAGQGTQAVADFYKSTPLGVQKLAQRRIRAKNSELLDKGSGETTRRKRVAKAKAEFDKIKSEVAKEVAASQDVQKAKSKASVIKDKPRVEEKVAKIREKRNDLFDQLKKLKKDRPLTSGGIDPRILEVRVAIGVTYIQEGYVRFAAWAEKMKAGFNDAGEELSDSDLAEIWNSESDGRLVADMANDGFIDENAEKLATRIDARINKRKGQSFDPVKMMIDTLFGKVDEKLAKQNKKSPVKAIDKIALALRYKQDYADVWAESKSEVEKMISDSGLPDFVKGEKIKELVNYFEEEIGIPFSEKQTGAAVSDGLKEMGETIDEILIRHPLEQDATRSALVDKLMSHAGLDRTIAEDIAAAFHDKYDKMAKDRQMAVLNKMFPENKISDPIKRKKDHEKIIEAVNAGALDVEGFERKFYDKFGLINEIDPQITKDLKAFSDRIWAAPDGFLKNNEYTKLEDYLANRRKEARGALAVDLWYANILSGYETHIRNLQFNAPTAFINMMSLLAQKQVMKGDWAGFVQIWKTFIGGQKRGALEASAVIRDGAATVLDEPGARGVLERTTDEGWRRMFAPAVIPGRFLRAADVRFTIPLAEAKQYELMLNEAKIRNAELPLVDKKTNKQIIQEVNELMGYTSERMASAKNTALNDIKRVYGENVDLASDKKASRDFKRRVFEIMERSRPSDIVEQSYEWSRRSLLTNKPEGTLGWVAKHLTTWSQGMPISKIWIPFVNVPFNIANSMIDRSPLGFIRSERGSRGLFLKSDLETPMSQDQIHEARLKAMNHTIAIGGLYALTQMTYKDDDGEEKPILEITANLTGDFQKNQTIKRGSNIDPYSVYIFGQKIFSYKYTPWAAALAPVGYMRDFDKYGDDKSLSSKIAAPFLNYMYFINDQAAMKGVNELMSGMSENNPIRDPEYWRKLFAKTARSMVAPNFVLQANNDIRGAFGLEDKRAIEWWEHSVKDVPLLEEMLKNRIDVLGREMKDEFDIPGIPFTIRDVNDPYFRLFNEKKYYPSFYKRRTITKFEGEGENMQAVEDQMSLTELNELNKIRGEYVLSILSEPEVVDDLRQLDNESFKKIMDKYFSEGADVAKEKLFAGE